MRCFYLAVMFLCLFSSCKRAPDTAARSAAPSRAAAVAALRPGEYPLWFQLGSRGPVLIDSIEDARFSEALVPWPLAVHIRFILAQNDEIVMAVNRDGFIRLAPWEEPPETEQNPRAREMTGLYHYSAGDFWRQYTVGSFVFFDDKPAALLYRDDRFLDSNAPLPAPRVWTFAAENPAPFALDIPAFGRFPPDEGWDIDALRYSTDGFWHYRIIRKIESENKILFFRSQDLHLEGDEVPLGSFQNSALPEPLSAAPRPLRSVFAAFDSSPDSVLAALSADFQGQRFFAHNGGSMVNVLAFLRSSKDDFEVLAIDLNGKGLRHRGASAAAGTESSPLILPDMPGGFVYTGIAVLGQTLIAVWEEQEDFSIGAAGFMVLRLPE